jgi:MFS family permease
MASLARVFVAGAALLGAGLAAMGLSPTVVVLLAASTVTGAFNGALNVATSALIYGRAAAQARGRVAALVGGVGSGAQLAAYAAGGALAGPLGPRTVFVAAGVLGALVPLLAARQVLQAAAPAVGASPADQALFSRRSRLGVSRGTSVG